MEQKRTKILLHACCAICSGYPIELLKELNYEPVIYFCNPNLDTLEEFNKRLEAQKQLCKKSLRSVLTFILGEIDDSVLLKRAGSFERYEQYKKLITESNYKNAKEITKECIENNISIGGSADILICAVLINKLKQNFIF